ncbi:putative HSP20-like chaperone [Rosa chinensis]|uniref:Putative HSP20-like chaperone n=1 Tax=Rosa chinensis TaxID=74649 RepID=A0A2P6QEW0_ROSCH|nr:inactive protein RESTRICTED TEV MOVEMENT 2 [Rosa chinensis]PRQ32724.1 putative HSP20-like chaperone [Rosa chinensis]
MATEGRPFAATANRVYEDIELPSSAEWVQDEGYDTLIVNLQGYKKENLRIQVTSTRNIRVLGERPVRPENNVWQRFRKEIQVPSNCDVNETSARFDNGFLYVKIPKTIAPVETAAQKDQKPLKPATEKPPPPVEAKIPKPQKPTSSTTTYVPQPAAASTQEINNAQKTNAAAQEQVPPSKPIQENKTDGSLEKEKVYAAVTTDQPSKVDKSGTTYEGAAETSKKTSMEKEKSDGFSANAQNVEEKSPTTEDANRGKMVDREYSTKEDAKPEEYCSMRPRGRGYFRQVVDGLVMELKEPRKVVINLAVAIGFVLIIGLYVKYAINSIEEFKRQEL